MISRTTLDLKEFSKEWRGRRREILKVAIFFLLREEKARNRLLKNYLRGG